MKVVIDIPNDLLERVKTECQREWAAMATPYLLQLFQAVANGTPLPKGHGRLIDADAFIKAECSQCDGNCGVCDCDCLNCKSEWRCDFIKDVDSADVIIEADKEVDE